MRALLSKSVLASRYALFAALSMLANIGMQAAVVHSTPESPLMVSMLAGTGAGFAVKYVLDKYWIFFDGWSGYAQEARKVTLYGIFGILMTVFFWGTEVTFLFLWKTSLAKYTGAVLGLTAGYTMKYMLDRRFVFGPGNA